MHRSGTLRPPDTPRQKPYSVRDTRRLGQTVKCLLVLALATGSVGCGSGDGDVSDKEIFGDTTTTTKTRTPPGRRARYRLTVNPSGSSTKFHDDPGNLG